MASTSEFWGTVRALPSRLAFWRRRDAPGSSWLARALALVTLIAVVAVRWWNPAPVEILRLKAFDFYQLTVPRDAKIGAVVIVDIDEESLAELGQWPWPRTVIARMVQNLMRAGAAAVGFDVVFAEPDRLSPDAIAGSVDGLDAGAAAALRKLPSNDDIFARALKLSRVVLGHAGRYSGKTLDKSALKKTPLAEIGDDPRPFLLNFPGLTRNLPALEQAAKGLGIFSLNPEIDGIVRRVPAIIRVGKDIFPTLSMEVLRVATGQTTFAIRTDQAGVKEVIVARVKLPTDNHGRFWVHFGPHDPRRYVSAKDVIAGTVPRQRLAGKLVLVGTSAAGLIDIKATPLGQDMPGVEIHAQLLENFLAKRRLYRPHNADGLEIVLGAVIGLVMIFLVPLLGAGTTLVVGVVMVAGLVGGAWYYYLEKLLLYDATFPVFAGFATYSVMAYTNYIREQAAKRQVRTAFSHYLSPDMVERLAKDPSHLKLGGEMKELTLLFCDIRGFTSISEKFDAEGLTAFINRFLTPMTEVILGTGGTIDKYMGDCIMAFWNAPFDDADHARNGCRAALSMMDTLAGLNDLWEAEAKDAGHTHIQVKVGIGLNTGIVCVGNMGSDQRFDYSVLGDDVNLASRLEGETKNFGVGIIVGENTARQVAEFALLPIGNVRVRGKTESTRIFTIVGDESAAAGADFHELKAAHGEMMDAFRLGKWKKIPALIKKCRRQGGPRLKGLYDYFESEIEVQM